MRLNSKMLGCPGAVLLAFLAPATLRADIIYDNGVQQSDFAYFSDVGSSNQFITDDFTLQSAANLSGISWTGIYNSGVGADLFEIRILENVNPTPGAYRFATLFRLQPASVTRVNTGETLLNRTLFQYAADVSGEQIELEAAREYWLQIYNETAGLGWAWATDTTTGTVVYANDSSNGQFVAATSRMDFALSGSAVPEPNGFILIMGSVGLISLRRKRMGVSH